MNGVKRFIANILPKSLLGPVQRAYHFLLPQIGALVYGYPSRKLLVLGVTGTKGKSSTTEMLNAILEEAGHTTAVLNSIRIKIADTSEPNLMRMSMPGRFFIQRFLAQAVARGCTAAIIEMTSEGARQYRHRAIDLDGLIFTNLAPEHIESHGSFDAYADAKFEIGLQLVRSSKHPRIIVANSDDPQGARYLMLNVDERLPFSLANVPHEATESGGHFQFSGLDIHIRLPGDFSLKNALAAATLARALGIGAQTTAAALEKLTVIPGRAQRIEAAEDFTVVVDYAHTPDSLEALYSAFGHTRKICVLGSTGGGRDLWKRPVMGGIADAQCDHVILTNEDPYDEDPRSIVEAMAQGMKRRPEIIMDRREAIARALSLAHAGDAVLITGKGTDPCICGPQGSRVPWSDAAVVREELQRRVTAQV